jgi:hypothetical protein
MNTHSNQNPTADLLDQLQRELGEIDHDLETGTAVAEPEATDDELHAVSELAAMARFSPLSGEVVDDLLADDDSIDGDVRARLTSAVELVLEELRLLSGALEPLLAWQREARGLSYDTLAEAMQSRLNDDNHHVVAERLREAETGAVRFDDLGTVDEGSDIIAAWIRTLELDSGVAVSALKKSLPELAGAGFGGGDSARRSNAEDFVRRVAERLNAEHIGD